MKMRAIQVSEEYLESLAQWMEEWVKLESSLTIPQFLKAKGIGYQYLKYFIYISPLVQNTFEVMKATLFTRWLDMAMSKEKMPAHRAGVLMRYIKYYDSHTFDLDQEARKEIASLEQQSELMYKAENYANEDLKGIHRELYDQNVDKRGSGEEA
tara:strand:- start:1393 stop:1854 length:462 start_codon:yes stop_codon:yes gene_type:complete